MQITDNLKKRFCKDYNIPINLFIDDFFYERLQLLDEFYWTLKKWEVYEREVTKYNSEQDYFEYYNKTKDDAISRIKSTEGYKRFNTEDMSKFVVPKPFNQLPSKDIYHKDNVGKSFISIDIEKANFNCLNYYDSEMFEHQGTWENYIGLYTNMRHIIESKYIRQVILGNCNPGRHITYEKWIMYTLVQWILSDENPHLIPLKNVAMLSNDELVLYDDENINSSLIKNIIENFERNTGIPIHVEKFKLLELEGLSYIKQFDDGSKKLKCAKAEFLPMVIHIIKQGEIESDDLYFMYEGSLASFVGIPHNISLACEKWRKENGFINS